MDDSVFCYGEGNGANCERRMELKCDPNCHTTYQQIEREKSHTQLSQTLDLRGEKILLQQFDLTIRMYLFNANKPTVAGVEYTTNATTKP